MSSTPTTFNLDTLTKTVLPASAAPLESHVTHLLTAATQLPSIQATNFLVKDVSTSFYQSPYYQAAITNKNPPSYSSYAKDPTGATDDNSIGDAALNYANIAALATGTAQTVLHGDQSIAVTDQDIHVTVQGNLAIGYGGQRVETVNGILNQKIYNGAKSIYNGTSTRFFDALVTTYEHADVQIRSFTSDTVLHFGDRTILRKGSETETATGNVTSTAIGTEKITMYGDATEITMGMVAANADHCIVVKNVTGFSSSIVAGLQSSAILGTQSNINTFGVIMAYKEQLAKLISVDYHVVAIDAVISWLEARGAVGKYVGVCVRATAAAFGILRM